MTQNRITLDELLRSAGRQLRDEFREIQECNPHSGDKGYEVEEVLKRFLSARLPKRFDVKSGVVIGRDGSVSRQCDVIIYDALNSFVYRNGPKLHILPRDNVAAVIEVKSKLNKDELHDAAKKIAAVKSIKCSPICGADQPVTFSDMIMTGTLGCVFAFDSYTSLETLAENLREINADHDSNHWIDLVVVLDKGCLSYAFQKMYDGNLDAWVGGPLDDEFMIPPFYVHLVQAPFGDGTLNHFFLKLMAHLTFFRKLSLVRFDELQPEAKKVQTIQGYQYNLSRQLVPAEERHQQGFFANPKVRYNLYLRKERTLAGQVCLLPWQDGAVITISSLFPPTIVAEQYFRRLKLRSTLVPIEIGQAKFWMSSVLPITEATFVKVSEDIHPELISVRDTADDNPPPTKI